MRSLLENFESVAANLVFRKASAVLRRTLRAGSSLQRPVERMVGVGRQEARTKQANEVSRSLSATAVFGRTNEQTKRNHRSCMSRSIACVAAARAEAFAQRNRTSVVFARRRFSEMVVRVESREFEVDSKKKAANDLDRCRVVQKRKKALARQSPTVRAMAKASDGTRRPS